MGVSEAYAAGLDPGLGEQSLFKEGVEGVCVGGGGVGVCVWGGVASDLRALSINVMHNFVTLPIAVAHNFAKYIHLIVKLWKLVPYCK